MQFHPRLLSIATFPVVLTLVVLIVLSMLFQTGVSWRRQAEVARKALHNSSGLVEKFRHTNERDFASLQEQAPPILNELEAVCTTDSTKIAAQKLAAQMGTMIGLYERLRWAAPIAPNLLAPIAQEQTRAELNLASSRLLEYQAALEGHLESDYANRPDSSLVPLLAVAAILSGLVTSVMLTGYLRQNLAQLTTPVAAAEEQKTEPVDNSVDVVCTIDKANCFVEVNPVMLRWGYLPETMIGLPIEGVLESSSVDTVHDALSTARAEGKSQFEATLMTPEGNQIDVVGVLTELANGNVLCVLQDISERKRLDRLIEQTSAREDVFFDSIPAAVFLQDSKGIVSRVNNHARALIRRFGASAMMDMKSLETHPELQVSYHERAVFAIDISERGKLEDSKNRILSVIGSVREPLQNILQVLKQSGKEQCAPAIAEAEKLTRLFNGILRVEREHLTEIRITPIENDMGVVVQRAVDAMYEQCEAARVKVQYAPPAPIMWKVDAPRMVQALSNLLVNALNHSIKGDRIDVRLRQTSFDEITIEVSDQGPSISEMAIAQVFEPFVQSRKSMKAGAAGLGLATAQAIVRAHGGAIRVSNNPGAGVTFTIILKAR
jgi:PAS domain S-box-containing protein